MIKSFADPEAERLFQGLSTRRLPADLQRAARRKLLMLDAAESLRDLRVPTSNHLEKLTRGRTGQFSIRINIRWRLCFEWKNDHAFGVEIVDYH